MNAKLSVCTLETGLDYGQAPGVYNWAGLYMNVVIIHQHRERGPTY